MINVCIIGTGNVSFHLEKAFSKTEKVHLTSIVQGRSDFDALLSKKVFSKDGRNPDVIIIAVSDDAIAEVASRLREVKQLVAHTSGSVSINDLPVNARKGVFYPLQSFSKEREVDLKTVPICLEANNAKDLDLLRTLAEPISDIVYEINSEQRKVLHLAAVFVSNFTNHLYHIGNEICLKNDLPFDLLKPLIAETASKIETLPAFSAQTGPAKRNDVGTISNHLEQLKTKNNKEIYTILTRSIQNTYGKKL